MALRQLMISKKIEQRKASLTELLTQEEGFNTRSSELETSIEEAKTDEEIAVVEEEITKLDAEKAVLDEKKGKLEGEITALEGELEKINSNEPKNNPVPTPAPQEPERSNNFGGDEVRMTGKRLNTRTQALARLNQPEVRSFYSNLKEAVEKRSITGLDITIPQIILDTITDDLGRYSVFYDLVRVAVLTGEARAIVSGEAPEAIWTEMVGKINELSSLFTDVEVDGYKVGGFIPLHNSLIEDSMVNLASYVEDLLKESIAIALDKAILYGTGTKMPLGIIPALQADFVDGGVEPDSGLRLTNIVTLSIADTKFANIIKAMKNIKRGRRGRGPITVAMNESTWLGTVVPMSLGSNAAGAFVTVSNQAFPGVGYKVVFCEEIPEDNLIVGDYTKYLLAQRSDVKTASSTEFLFTEDKTVFKATQRFDGKPVREAAFVLIGLNNVTPTVTASFAVDSANA